MNFNNNKRGFTLAELMVVLLVLSIIFAAFAPLITKRRTASNRSKYAVWNWVAEDATTGPRSAYYEPGDATKTGTALIGISPETEADVTALSPNARMIIRSSANIGSGSIQRQMQFRYGTNSSNTLAGTWLMDTKNILLGGVYNDLTYTTDSKTIPSNNIAIGYKALDTIKNSPNNTISPAKNNVAIGNRAGENTGSSYGQDNTYIGYQAGKDSGGTKGQTFIGAKAGSNNKADYNTAIGYMAGNKVSATATGNTFIGHYAGMGDEFDATGVTGKDNYVQGYNALMNLTSGSNNVAIGAFALHELMTGSNNVAIGKNACQYVKGSNKTCIGDHSGPKPNSSANRFFRCRKISSTTDLKKCLNGEYSGSSLTNDATTDAVERTYIGSTPHNYGGDAVLEIHNIGGKNNDLVNGPAIKSNTTTVINGNLIVRGKIFFTSGSDLWNMHHDVDVSLSGTGDGPGINKYHPNDYKCTNNQASFTWASFCPDLTSASDRRLKNIGFKSTDGLNKINELKIYNFNFKDDKTKTPQVGVIAQELQKVFPTAVFKGDDGYLKIRWDEMFFASINAIKELDLKVTTLIKKATSIEAKIAKLEKQNEQLKIEVAQLTNKIEALKRK